MGLTIYCSVKSQEPYVQCSFQRSLSQILSHYSYREWNGGVYNLKLSYCEEEVISSRHDFNRAGIILNSSDLMK